MASLACLGATLTCSMGTAPSALLVLPQNRVLGATPIANILDNKPLLNVLPFAMCRSPANPAVAAATAAALGVLTPMPCVPVTPAPWMAGVPTVLIGDMPALDMSSTLLCSWGGLISITNAGQVVAQG
ncbi:hypothetical protein SOCEGT47_038100 [Sorangium cellulosum]|uniref:DUF4280 domain-containing protein n=1 Tax=Sorangium cellulosum TaxID=56 RepID=A0A4P2Q1X6_SORCE|nr:DUF4280 domain-containing protein [Sorangium cellulosum]AUX23287.1 hypothetical protein SOCEGT47_038100 [Sorangium cellulosum]